MNAVITVDRPSLRSGIALSPSNTDTVPSIGRPRVTTPPDLSDLPSVWLETFTVRSYEVSPSYTATVQTLMDYFQEAAGNHTRRMGMEGGIESGWVWVMLRFRLRVYERPVWRSSVTVETWARGFKGIRAERAFRFVDEHGNLLAEGTSFWAVIDLLRRRPMRPPEELNLIPISDRKAPDFDERFLHGAPTTSLREVDFYVRQSDLDVNQHVNNVCYLDWALEAVPSSFRIAGRLTEIDMAFKSESHYGDTIISSVGDGEHGTLMHQLARQSDGRALAWVRTWWS